MNLQNLRYWARRVPFLVKNGSLAQMCSSHVRHAAKEKYPRLLPVATLDEIVSDCDVEIIEGPHRNGNVSEFELYCISKLVKAHRPEVIFEIGTFDGKTALHLAANSPAHTRVFTLDLPRSAMSQTKLRIKSGERLFIDKEESGTCFSGTEFDSKITQMLGDSANFDHSHLVKATDFIFIDGSHSYEYVLNDTRLALNLLRDGRGVILWHDYAWPEVIKALNEFYMDDPVFLGMKNIAGTSLAYLHLS